MSIDREGPDYDGFVRALAAAGFQGDLSRAASHRVVQATDNSIYQVQPDAVAFPANEEDLIRIARLIDAPQFHDVVLRPRGGGTGTNGQSLGDGLVVDCSRYMTGILEVNAEEGWVRVQPGVIKDQLNAALFPHGLFFAPELSTSSRATLGGMISTDACGQGSCTYGKTSTHVLNLRAVMVGGDVLDTRRAPYVPTPRDGRMDRVLGELDAISRDQADLIAARFPRLNRTLTGYDLAHVREGDTIDPAAVLCGSEGTLALLSEAKLNVLPIPAASALLLVFYPDFQAALRDARDMAGLGATSVETIDSRVLRLAREEAGFATVAHLFPDAEADGVNIVEFTGDSEGMLLARLAGLRERLAEASGRLEITLATGPEAAQVWRMRKQAVGLLGRASGAKRPVPFVEDCAVPPENLEPFIAAFRALLDRRGLEYGMFGHVDAGVLHVRPALDLTDPEQEPLIREITEEVAALAHAHGGLLWGEHGKGVRSEFVPEVFGPLYPALQRIKAAFDPRNQMNPGKIAAPGDEALWAIDKVALRGQADRSVAPEVRAAYAPAFGCNGNGACHGRALDDVMCPSFKLTGDRRHSPKGRASLVREWLRQGGAEGHADAGFEDEVKTALDGCLSCAACASQCPVRVDVPAFRARFLQSYHRRHRRPLRDHALAALEGMMPLAARVRPAFNLMTRGPGRGLMARLGLDALPTLPRQHRTFRWLTRAAAQDLDPKRDVVLVPDAFTTFFEPALVNDLDAVLTHLGRRLWVAPYRPSGKARQVLGRLEGAQAQAARLSEGLRPLAASGVPLIGLEPAITYAMAPDSPECPEVILPQHLLAQLVPLAAGDFPPPRSERHMRLLPHCSERVRGAAALDDWHKVFAAFAITLDIPATGCCGMAGTWGHETRNRAASRLIFEQSWSAAVSGDPAGPLATGYSCRCQTGQITGKQLNHPISFLRALLEGQV